MTTNLLTLRIMKMKLDFLETFKKNQETQLIRPAIR